MQIVHPSNDPALVSYHRPELISSIPALDLALDCWNLLDTGGRGIAKEKYLHREPAEPKSAYSERLHRSTYTPIYRDSIRAYAGLLNRFQLIDSPPSMASNEHNIDLQGSSIQSFWNRCDELALRDGGIFIMVDMMPETEAKNFFDQQNDGRHPYLIQVERRNLINWSSEFRNGREFVLHATVRQLQSVPDRSGYGVVIEPIYYVLKPGLVESYRLEKKDQRWTQIKIDSIQTSLPVVPIVWYGANDSKFAQGDLPMNGLAELSVQHYQMRSDLQELLHKCAMPVPVRKGAPVGPDGRPSALILGPNTAVDLPGEGSDFNFAEPSGKSIERHQAEITHLEALMDRSGLNFLYGANIKTATEASLRASQIASQVSALVRNKVSAFNSVMTLWAAYAGELQSLTKESGIAINDSLINRPIDPSGVAQMVNLYSSGLLSRRTVLDELQRGGILDPELKVDEEELRIDTENQTQSVESSEPVANQVRQNRVNADTLGRDS
ncbi:MAG: DUF4055 domain-containing protein [bacterium]|jgi:hypothetical protein